MEPTPTPSSPWSLRDPILVYLAALVASAVALFLAHFAGLVDLVALANGEESDQAPRIIMVAAVGQYLTMYLGLRLMSSRKGTGNFQNDYHLHVDSTDWPFLLYGAGLLIVSSLALAGVFALLGVDAPTQEVIEAAAESDNLGETVVIALVVGIVAPILEEMLFRGVLLDVLKARFAVSPAIWITGVVFGLVHLTDPATLLLVPALVGLGVVLGYVRERAGGSLSRPILMHMGFNGVTAVTLVLSLLLFDDGNVPL